MKSIMEIDLIFRSYVYLVFALMVYLDISVIVKLVRMSKSNIVWFYKNQLPFWRTFL